jgi:hypothetical protein
MVALLVLMKSVIVRLVQIASICFLLFTQHLFKIPSELSAACSRHQPGISGLERVAPE